MITAFLNATIFTGEEMITGKALIIEDDCIKEIIDIESIPAAAIKIDCKNSYLAPGLIDLQIYGGGGYLFSNEPTSPALKSITSSLRSNGTTGFFLTLATNSLEVFRKAIKVVKENPHPELLGLHFEGPYINPIKRGAHLIEYIKKPERKEVEDLLREAEGVLKMITLAPEMCDEEIIQLLKDNGILISAGHSNATFSEATDGFNNGITTTTHLFNAMSPMHHRETGLPGAVFLHESACASIIADGIHVDYETVMVSKRLLNERLFLITDAVEEVKEGAYVHVKQSDRFTLPDGTLSGSCLTLLQAIRNCVDHAAIPLDEALRMASMYPAQLINSLDTGKIKPGYKANLVIFSDDFRVSHTVVEGKVYDY
ncbi:MAG: N-acetylglucosamine-6-phosphate deacetylase [Ginsengibacter sp.]